MTNHKISSLGAFFDTQDLAWKPVAVSRESGKARVIPYVTNRAIMDRLDIVCGPENWRNEFVPGPDGGLLCGLSLRIVREDGRPEWVTKWDGAENTEIQPVKGGISSSMRRAAVQWGIGRYLYRIPAVWARVDERGRLTERPSLPREYLPRPHVAKPVPLRVASGDSLPEIRVEVSSAA